MRNAFTEFGQITSMSYKQGFAFVDYADHKDAADAIQSMNGKQLGGRMITVEISGRPPRNERPAHARDGPGGGSPAMPRGNDDMMRSSSDMRSDTRGGFGGFGANSRSQSSSDIATRNLFVANIPETLNEEDIRNHFSR